MELMMVFNTLSLLGALIFFVHLYNVLVRKPERLRAVLRKRGISGPRPTFLLGNMTEFKKALSTTERKVVTMSTGPRLSQLCRYHLPISGEVEKAIRKILAPEFYMDKVKGMINLINESAIPLISSWSTMIEKEGGIAAIKIDEGLRNFSGDIIARACFGSNYLRGQEIFFKLRELKEVLSKKAFSIGIPGMRNGNLVFVQRFVKFARAKSPNAEMLLKMQQGVNLWTFAITTHTDPEIWGPDSYNFNPDRFANGTAGACKFPQLYMPFGIGPRVCLGQHMALVELKLILALLLSNFSFSLSPNYIHSPIQSFVIEPEHGVHLMRNRTHDECLNIEVHFLSRFFAYSPQIHQVALNHVVRVLRGTSVIVMILIETSSKVNGFFALGSQIHQTAPSHVVRVLRGTSVVVTVLIETSSIVRGVIVEPWGSYGTSLRFLSSHGDDHLTKDEVIERVLSVIKSFPKVDPAQVTPDVHFQKDLGLDSLDNVEIVMALEEEFKLEIPDKEADKIDSCNLAIEYIYNHPMAG
ncbi:hypothetical protein SO802_008957 [Lithocarpus litseifolius]|uniref:Acyl carrier protein n=1 Tax=Lithocarpus litseifolius TaxID=425828 RepID=A0AAW2DA18_9ROSI